MGYNISGSELNDPEVQALLKKFGTTLTLNPKEIEEDQKIVKYPEYLHATEPSNEGKFYTFQNPDGAKNDKGRLGDKSFKNLFKGKYTISDLSPNFGSEIDGIQLSELDDAGKNDLALLLETRALVVFRNQDLKDKGPQFNKEFGEYFGPLHIHPVSLSVKDYPELFVTYRRPGDGTRYEREFGNRDTLSGFHSDISFEEYPASFSFFVALEAPKTGGDTVFIDTREAYRRLSPYYQKFLEGLTAIHSNYYQNLFAKVVGGKAKVKADYFTEHPLVRTHPVTGEKGLYYSRAFIQRIKGLKKKESDSVLNFLEDHFLKNPEIQVRASHNGTDAGTVVAWDNRILLHSAVTDFLQHTTGPRHHYRITVLGEKPYFDPNQETIYGPVGFLDKSDDANGANGHTNGHANVNGHTNGH